MYIPFVPFRAQTQSAMRRRDLLCLLPLPFIAACSRPPVQQKDPMARVAPFVQKDLVWNSSNFLDFLASLPPAGMLALKKSLELLPADATETALKGTQVDVMEINTDLCQKSSWFGICRNSAAFNYHSMVMNIADQAKVDPVKLRNASTFEAEQLLTARVVSEIEKEFIARWDKMSVEQRKAVLVKVDPNRKLKDHAAIAAGTGAAAIGVLSATVAFTGFAAYLAATTALAAAAGVIGATLPFAAYTSLTTLIALVTGPVGWAAGALLAVTAALFGGKPDTRKLAGFVLTMHALKLDALRAAGN